MKWLKTYKCIFFIVLSLIILPLFINYCYTWETDYRILYQPSAWTVFWATYLSAIASFAMVFVTWKTLKQNSQQLNELKRQWEEDNRPRIYPRIIVYNKAFFLELFNSGRTDAFDVDININQIFIDNLSEKGKDSINDWINSPFFIKAGKSVYAYIGWCEEIVKNWKSINFDLEIEGTYNEIYKIEFSLPVSQFTKRNMVVRTPTEHVLEELAKGLVKPNRAKKILSSQELLESIDESLKKITNYIKTNNTRQSQ